MHPWLVSFLCGVAVDAAYAYYVKAVQRNQRWRAATSSVAIAAPGFFSLLSSVEDHSNAIPYFAGLFVGTLLISLTWENKHAQPHV